MKARNIMLGGAIVAAAALAAGMHAQQEPSARMMGALSNAAPVAADDSLVEQGKTLYTSASYKCNTCHGDKGEGGDGPDLTGSLLNEEEIARFLQKPSVLAISRGMPTIPANSPDLHPLVAFVFSLQK